MYGLDAAIWPVDFFVFSSFLASSFIILGESVTYTHAEFKTDDDPAFVLVSPTPENFTGMGLVTPDPSLACDAEDSWSLLGDKSVIMKGKLVSSIQGEHLVSPNKLSLAQKGLLSPVL